MSSALLAGLRDFAIAALSLFALTRLLAVASGEPLLPVQWHGYALPIGMAAIFAAFRHAARRD